MLILHLNLRIYSHPCELNLSPLVEEAAYQATELDNTDSND